MKRSYSRPAEFWRTFTLSLAAAGLVFALGWLLITRPTAEELTPPSSPLLPGTESRLTVLALGLSEEKELSLCALVSFQPDLIAIQVAALPPQTVWQTEMGSGTLAAAWQQGGAAYLQSVLTEWLGIPIHRTLCQNRQQLSAMMAQCGPLPYTLPISLAEDAPGSRILFPAGRYYLDGEALADLITLPLPANPARQSDRAAELIKALVRQHLPAVLTESGEELVTHLLTHSDSDLTLLDYLERRTALGTLARREEIPVYCVYLDGTTGQEGYYLSEVSLACLQAAFPAG